MSKHTELTARNFYEFSATVLLVQMTHMGFSLADLAMVARLGLEKAGGTGLGELVLQVCLAPLYGLFTVYAGQLARLEGAGQTAEKGGSLISALVLLLVAFSAVIAAAVALSPRALIAAGQPPTIVALTSEFVSVRSLGLPIEFLFGIMAVSMRVLGLKSYVLAIVALGLGCNVILNWIFLFGPARALFAPMQALASTTVISYMFMLIGAVFVFRRSVVKKGRLSFANLGIGQIREFTRVYLRKAPLMGVRNLNDYAVSAVITLLLGTLGPEVLSAAAISSSIIVFLYRVPQACCSATYTYYSYHLDKRDPAAIARRLVLWSAIPTAVAGLAVFLFSPLLASVYGVTSKESVYSILLSLLNVYLAFLPFYFLEHILSNFLNARLITFYPWLVSSVVSYALTIPLAIYAARFLLSPEMTLAAQGVGSLVIAAFYGWHMRRREGCHALLPQSA